MIEFWDIIEFYSIVIRIQLHDFEMRMENFLRNSFDRYEDTHAVDIDCERRTT